MPLTRFFSVVITETTTCMTPVIGPFGTLLYQNAETMTHIIRPCAGMIAS